MPAAFMSAGDGFPVEVQAVLSTFSEMAGSDGSIHVAGLAEVLRRVGISAAADDDAVKILLEGAGMAHQTSINCREFIASIFDTTIGHRNRGISVEHLLRELIVQVERQGQSREAKVYEIEPTVIRPKGEAVRCPRDGKMGAAYVDSVFGPWNAGAAQFMLSYTWGYAVGDIVDTLEDFCLSRDLAPRSTYIWMCCLCINQHRVKEAQIKGEVVPFSTFEKAFGERVGELGQVIAMMSPWNKPEYITRIWCDFEIFTAIHVVNAPVTVVMPPREAANLRSALLYGDLEEVWNLLASLNVAEAQASVEQDRENILKLIQDGPGFFKLNTVVAEHLQSWIIESSEGYLLRYLVSDQIDYPLAVHMCQEVGHLLVNMGHLERADRVLNAGREICEAHDLANTARGAALLVEIGSLMGKRGDLDEAIATYKQAQRIYEVIGMTESPEAAMLWRRLGRILGERGDLQGKLQLYLEARRILEAEGQLETPDGAELLSNIGAAKRQMNDRKGALEAYEEALAVRTKTNTLKTPGAATLLSNMGYAMRKPWEALAVFEQARQIREQTCTLETPAGATLLVNMAGIKGKMKDLEGKLALYREAVRIREKTGTLDTTAGAIVLSHIGGIYMRQSDASGAVEHLSQARRIRKACGTLEQDAGATLLSKLGSAYEMQGDGQAAGESFGLALQIRRNSGIVGGLGGQALLQKYGLWHMRCGTPEEAVALLEESRRVASCMGKKWKPKQDALLLRQISEAKTLAGDAVGAAAAYNEAEQVLADAVALGRSESLLNASVSTLTLGTCGSDSE